MSFQDLEDVLGNATPLPCSIDSMQLMFDAGVEQQKKNSRVSRTFAVSTAATSFALMFTTILFAVWTYRLSNENSRLSASLEQNSQSVDSSSSSNEHKKAFQKEFDTKAGSAKGEVDRIDSKADGQRSNTPNSSRQFQNSNWKLTYRENDRLFHLRGVALRAKDEFREPVETGHGSFSSKNDPMQVYSGASNLNLRQQIQEDLWGP